MYEEFPLLKRSYTVGDNDLDNWNILCGRCPYYALSWGDDTNKKYWGEGHNFIIGKDNKEMDDMIEQCSHSFLKEFYLSLRETYRSHYLKKKEEVPILYCRYENVLDSHFGESLWTLIRDLPVFILVEENKDSIAIQRISSQLNIPFERIYCVEEVISFNDCVVVDTYKHNEMYDSYSRIRKMILANHGFNEIVKELRKIDYPLFL
jgi:hypothetical protein